MSLSGTRVRAATACLALLPAMQAAAQSVYYPAAGEAWQRRTPEQVGLSARAVKEAVALAIAGETTSPRDLAENQRRTFGREPHGEIVGPFRPRGDAAGMIVRRGYIVAEWGDPNRVDVSNSVTKSFLTTTVGLAYDRKMIRDLHEPVRASMTPILVLNGAPAGSALVSVLPNVMGAESNAATRMGAAYDAFDLLEPFESEHNRKITWDHLLRQTSDWQGTLWGKPDWADRPSRDTAQWRTRPRLEPGTEFEYNDVRVNVMALASLNIWRRPLPQVLKEYVMDPIGASHTWRWFGYDNSWVVMDGALVQSVAGGAHWGGGMFISARDMARFGYLTLRRGKWGERQILSDEWIRRATTPGPNAQYGFANFYLNTGRRALPSAPEQAFYHLGAGNNVVYVDPVNDLVIVTRWISDMRALDAVIKRVLTKS